MYKLRPHQQEKSKQLLEVLSKYKIAYLAGETRSGKTLTALNTAKLYKAQKVLFITKKKAISSIQDDYNKFGFTYDFTIINYESVHKLESKDFDLVIYDEAHSISAYAKPSKRTRLCKQLFHKIPCILMSGTPATESYSQLYHQFWISDYTPFKEWSTFYKWARVFVDKKELRLPTHTVTDYSGAKVKEIDEVIKPYFVKMTKQDANFSVNIKEHYLEVETPKIILSLCKKLLKDKAIEGKTGFILGDTPAKLQSKVHQLYNGSCIIETADGDSFPKIFDTFKADFIRDYFVDTKIAIMYYYQAELEILKKVFKDKLTTELEEFNLSHKNLAIQANTTEGMNLSKADALVYYNLGFSGQAFIQSRDRLTVKERKNNDVYFVCETKGITKKILDAVQNKKDFNSRIFKKSFQL